MIEVNAGLRFIAVFVAASLAGLFVLLAASLTIDPYWVRRETPPWLEMTGGRNRLIDVHMRRAKQFQFALRAPTTVIVGSSVVYRGVRVADLHTGLSQNSGVKSAYNFGLASLMADELPIVAGIIKRSVSVETVVIGLDYFMFSGFPGPPRLRDEASAGALQGLRHAARLAMNTDGALGLLPQWLGRAEPGVWERTGFKHTPDFEPVLTRRVNAEQNISSMDYRADRLKDLAQAIDILNGKRLVLYLSPVSGAQLQRLRQGGRGNELAQWRGDIRSLASARSIAFTDLIDTHPFDDFDPDKGSSAHWIDNMHFKPHVGSWVLEKIGVQ